ncbi:hypothetical protein J2S65_005239 [Rhodococcus fascians]|nr:hypothetical protein [Rhodococcus fascians]
MPMMSGVDHRDPTALGRRRGGVRVEEPSK